jgi:hypothetical protein
MKKRLIGLGIVIAFAAVIVAVYTFTPKANANKPVLNQTSSWVVNNGAGLYGRINLKDLELDNKEQIEDGNIFRSASVVQSNNNGTLAAGGKYYQIDSKAPTAITAETIATAENMPGNAATVTTAGNYTLMLAADGNAYVAPSDNLHLAKHLNDNDKFVTASVRADGVAIGYTEDRQMIKFDYNSGKRTSLAKDFGPNNANYSLDTFEVTLFGDDFALLHASAGASNATIFLKKSQFDVKSDAKLAEPTVDKTLYLSQSDGLYKFDKELQRVAAITNTGVPSRPLESDISCNGNNFIYTAWTSGAGIATLDCNFQEHLLQDSAPRSGSSEDRGVEINLTPNGATLNATKTGEVWVATRDSWQVVPSTLNNWQTQLDKQLDDSQHIDPKENVCPVAPSGENAVFGVRPGKDNRIPVLLTALDGNRQDTLTIVGEPISSNDSMGEFRVIDNGQALALDLSDSTGSPRSTTVTVNVTDGGNDAKGTCLVPMTYTIQEHPYSAANETPKQLGNGVPTAHLQVAKYPATATVDALTGWVDPDGDDLLLETTNDNVGKAVANPNGELTFQPENVDIGASADVGIQVFDNLGVSARSKLTFTVFDNPPINLDSISRTGKINTTQTVDLTPYIHGSVGYVEVQLSDIPQGVTADIDPTGTKVLLSANGVGNYRITYTVEGSQNPGVISYVATDSENSKLNIAPMSVFLQSNEDTTVDVSSMVTNNVDSPYFITNTSIQPKLNNNAPVADISANVIGNSSVRIAGSLLTNDSVSNFHDGGNVEVTLQVYNPDDKQTYTTTSRIEVFITTSATTIPPIAVTDQVIVHKGQSATIDALKNDIAAFGDTLLLDPRYSTPDTDIASKGLAYVQGNKLRYIAPSNPASETLTLNYYVYVRGHAETTRAMGAINVKLIDGNASAPLKQNLIGSVTVGGAGELKINSNGLDRDANQVSVKTASVTSGDGAVQLGTNGSSIIVSSIGEEPGLIQGEYTLTDGQFDTVAQFYVNVTDSNQKAVGYNNYLFGNDGKEVKVTPLDNDIIPKGQTAKIVDAKLLPPAGGKADASLREITEEDQLNNLSLKVGEAGSTSIWQIKVELHADNTVAGSMEGETIGTFTENVILKTTDEKSLPEYPVFTDTYVKNSEIHHRKTFTTDVAKNLSWTGSSSDFIYSPTTTLNSGNKVQFTGSESSGDVNENTQELVFKASNKSDPTITTYGVISVPALSGILPQRKNQDVKSVEVGKLPLKINVADEIEQLEDTTLSIDNSVESPKLRPQSSCSIDNGVITYEPNKMRDGLTVDTDTKDTCSVYVAWSDEPKSRTLITFQINIIPEVTEPTLALNPQLQELEPKQTLDLDLKQYIKWYGHSSDEVAGLTVSCNTASSSENIIAICQGLTLHIEIPQKAQEIVNHHIDLTINDHSSPTANWTLHVKAAPKSDNIEIPLHNGQVIIQEGKDAPTVSVMSDVTSWLDRYYYGFQGGNIECAGKQDNKVTCATVGNGVLKFGIAANSEDTGFMAVGRYQFTDRPDSGGGQNKGTGTVTINYQALPKRPPQPALNFSDAQNGVVNLTVSEAAASVPETTDLCLHVNETGQDLCKNPGGAMSVSFSSDAELAGLTKWQTYTFHSFARNIVGVSPDSIDIKATPFVPLKSPDVTWSVTPDHKLHLQVTNLDPNTDEACGVEIKSSAFETKCFSPGTSAPDINMQPGTNWTVQVIAKARKVIAGSQEITPAPSQPVSVNAIMPALPDATITDVVGDNQAMMFKVKGTFNNPSPAATKYQYFWSANGNCGDTSKYQDYNGSIADSTVPGNPGQSTTITLCTRSLLNTSGLIDYGGSNNGTEFDKLTINRQAPNLAPPADLLNDITYTTVYSNSPHVELSQQTIEQHHDCGFFDFFCHDTITYNIIVDTPPSSSVQQATVHLETNGGRVGGTYTVKAAETSAKYLPKWLDNYVDQSVITSGIANKSYTFPEPVAAYGYTLNSSDASLSLVVSGTGFVADGNTINFTGTPSPTVTTKQEWNGTVKACVTFGGNLNNLVSSTPESNKSCWDYTLHYEYTVSPCQYDPTLSANDPNCVPPETTDCPTGQKLVDGKCVPDDGGDPGTSCPAGQHLENGECVADSGGGTTTCPTGQHLENGSCVADSSGGGSSDTPTDPPTSGGGSGTGGGSESGGSGGGTSGGSDTPPAAQAVNLSNKVTNTEGSNDGDNN